MGDIVIDTDVASVLQKGRAPAWVTSRVVDQRVWLTFVTVAELWKWAEVRSWGAASRDRLSTWMARWPFLPYDEEVARTWGRLASGAQLRGRRRPQNDTWIARCIRHGVPLITLNAKYFEDFARHEGLILLGE